MTMSFLFVSNTQDIVAEWVAVWSECESVSVWGCVCICVFKIDIIIMNKSAGNY